MIAEDEKILFISNARVISLSKNIFNRSQGKISFEHRVCVKENRSYHKQMLNVLIIEQPG